MGSRVIWPAWRLAIERETKGPGCDARARIRRGNSEKRSRCGGRHTPVKNNMQVLAKPPIAICGRCLNRNRAGNAAATSTKPRRALRTNGAPVRKQVV